MQRVITITFLSLVLTNAYGNYDAILVGNPQDMIYAKEELQAHISRESHFCRGASYPEMEGGFACKRTGPGEETCKIKFHCSLVKPGKTRMTNMAKYSLSDRGLKALRKMQTTVGGKKVSFKEKRVFVDGNKADLKIYEDDHSKKEKAFEGKTREDIRTAGYLSFEKLDQLVEQQQYGVTKLEVDSPLNDNFEMDLSSAMTEEEELEKELAALMEGEDDFQLTPKKPKEKKIEKVKSEVRSQKRTPVKKASTSSRMTERSHGLFLLGLSYSMISTASSKGSIAQSADIAWSPVIKLTHNWAVRGHFGYHNVRAFITETDDEETFSAYDYGLAVEHTVLEQAYLDVGLGIQTWQSTVGGSFSTFSLGGGYRLQDSFLWLVDQIFINYTSVSNSDGNKEFRVGLRTYF